MIATELPMDYPQPVQPYASPQPIEPVNGMGLAGFICSLVAIITCGLLSPVSLIISLLGLSQRPRGLAAAGTVISLLGCILGVGMAYAVVRGVEAANQAIEKMGTEIQAGLKTAGTLASARKKVEDHKVEKGEYPDDEEGQALVADLTDGWEMELRYQKQPEGYDLRSAGPDKQFDTDDDVLVEDVAGINSMEIDSPDKPAPEER
jgi:hypothetical protein